MSVTDPVISNWPVIGGRRVVKAEAQLVGAGQSLYRIEFLDSAGKKLFVQLPKGALRSLADSAGQLLDSGP
jgi:hypothetical protein